MKKLIGCLLVLSAMMQETGAQTRFIVRFRDKATTPYQISNPSAYLSARAIQRRTAYGIAIDSTDLPVTPRYIDSVRLAGTVTILNVSRWLNSVTIQTTDAAALAKINSLPFVRSATNIAARTGGTGGSVKAETVQPGATLPFPRLMADTYSYGASRRQIEMHNGQFLHNIGLSGQNMVISMLDGGFFSYQTLRAFDSARANGQILGTWDFVAREASVNEDNSHGMQCFSIIAANIPDQFVGSAPKASFYLFRSEDVSSEYPIEEHNWVCAAERADSSGSDMISSSLGYYDFDNPAYNYTFSQMDGNTTMAVIGADLAAKKGLLVVNSAGNEGNNSWGRIATPADGDSVLAVGAVNAEGWAASFTSRGPSADGQVKPDVASRGVQTTLQLSNNTVGASNGTSFSAPNITGLAACLWQGFREFNNMAIIYALRLSGSRAANPNDSIGYGIPDMKKAMLLLLKAYTTASATVSNCKTTISWAGKNNSSMRYEVERRLPGQNTFTKVGEIAGTGATFGNRSMQYSDSLINVAAGAIDYRVRQVIDTSAAAFSADYLDTIQVNLGNACITTSIDPVNGVAGELRLMPNPARNTTTLRVTTTNAIPKLVIRIGNTKGQVVRTTQAVKPAGTSLIDISLSELAAGTYYISVFNGDRLLGTRELIKL